MSNRFYVLSLAATLFLFTLNGLCATNDRYKTDPYSTHQPVLYKMANETTGPIIEFGCGYGSTDLLHDICKSEGRLLISIDDNREWLEKFSSKYMGDGYEADNSGWHKFYFVPGKSQQDMENADHWVKFLDELEILKTTVFDLCFIDQHPWLGRWETIKKMKDITRYVILHDCDYFPVHGIFGTELKPIVNRQPGSYDFSDIFKFFKVYFPLNPWPGDTGPPTLLGSNFESKLPEINFAEYDSSVK